MEVSQRVDNEEARVIGNKARGAFLGRNGGKCENWTNWTNITNGRIAKQSGSWPRALLVYFFIEKTSPLHFFLFLYSDP